MTDVTADRAVLAVMVIDEHLSQVSGRSLFSEEELCNILLDIRLTLQPSPQQEDQ